MSTFVNQAAAIAKWKLDNPFPLSETVGGEIVTTSFERWEEMALDRGAMLYQDSLQADAVAERALTKQQFISGMAEIRSDLALVNDRIARNVNLTPGEIRGGFKHILEKMLWLGDRIADGTIPTRE